MLSKKIVAGLVAALVASLCCITPILALLTGMGSIASSLSWLEPYRNYLVIFTLIILSYAWWDKLKEKSSAVDCSCDEKGSIKFLSTKKFLAGVTVFALLMLSLPYWAYELFDIKAECTTCVSSVDETVKVQEVKKHQPLLEALPTAKDDKSSEKPCLSEFVCTGTGYYESDMMMADARKVVEEMHGSVLKKMIDNDEDVVLLDVRQLHQRAEGEIYAIESLAIARGDLEFEILNKIKNKDAVIVAYSRSGGRSLFAAQTLKKLGYKNAYSLKGGLKGWVSLGYPFENGLGVVVKVVPQ